MSWTDGPLLGFDTETTGVDVDNDRIVTAALVRRDATGTHVRSWLIDPGVDIPEAAAAIHGVSTEHAREHGRPAARGAGGDRRPTWPRPSAAASRSSPTTPRSTCACSTRSCGGTASDPARPPVQRRAPGDRPARARPRRGPAPAGQAQARRPVRVLPGGRVREPAHRGRRRRRDARRARADRRPLPAPGRRSTSTRCTSTSRRRTRRGPRASTRGALSRASTGPGRRTSGRRGSPSARSGETHVISRLSSDALRRAGSDRFDGARSTWRYLIHELASSP